MDATALRAEVSRVADELKVPGVSVGVLIGGEEHYAFHGVTSVENPLPVDEATLFQFGSTGKTFTATTVMVLVERGVVSLGEKVRAYVPELTLRDVEVAREVTVGHLLNHTAGWEGDAMDDTGEGDDALERFVAAMADLQQVSPLGAVVSYNNASLSLAGRVIEKVTGKTFEQAVRELVLDPLKLDQTFFFQNDIMTRRFVVGHHMKDGEAVVVRPWGLPRGGSPAGGLSANAHDQLGWARFHLGDGAPILSRSTLDLMKEPTADMVGSALGDYVGLSWLLRDVGGVRLVSHGGSMIGQHSEFVMVPERDFAFIAMTNADPNGPEFNKVLQKWALMHYLGVDDADPVGVRLADDELAPYLGEFETIAAWVRIGAAEGQLRIEVELKPEMAEKMAAMGEDVSVQQPPIEVEIQAGNRDRYIVSGGPAKGMVGYFARDDGGGVIGVNLGGRFATRVQVAG